MFTVKRYISNQWMSNHCRDPWVIRARQEGMRARSGFKIIQIQKKFQIIKPDHNLLELGAAPGAWTQQLVKMLSKKSKLIAVDQANWSECRHATCLSKCDFMSEQGMQRIYTELDKLTILHGVLSDACPNITGQQNIDYFKIAEMIEFIWKHYVNYYKQSPSQYFIFKCFDGVLPLLKCKCPQLFANADQIHKIRVESTKVHSSEVYILCELRKSQPN
ncbi:hypothetical protein GJ496_007937 [Pomphorhynchus laevis]|nr:hypothetical protein GJ496_007937 [Pomphorhynchus laevis]